MQLTIRRQVKENIQTRIKQTLMRQERSNQVWSFVLWQIAYGMEDIPNPDCSG
jgi:hypothetical protein